MAADPKSAGALIPLRKEHVEVIEHLMAEWREAEIGMRAVISMAIKQGNELSVFVEREYPAAFGWVWKFDKKRKALVLIRPEGRGPAKVAQKQDEGAP